MKSTKHIELIDVVDNGGRPTGQRKTWLNLINDGDWRNVIHIWIINPNAQLLVQKRSVAKSAWKSLWDVSIGGGVSAGEEPTQAAVRELNEELGIEVDQNDLKKLGVWKVPKVVPEYNKESREFSHTYLLQKDLMINDLSLEKKEVAQVAWRSLEELRAEIEDDKLYKNWVPHPKQYYLEVMNFIEERAE
ncbi:MAG: NUDIX domain-containing protein [Candidatus Saccharimonadales bacterium]